MAALKEYAPELLVEAITALDWSTEHPTHAMKAIQDTVRKKFADELSDDYAMNLIGGLIDHGFIRTRIDPQVTVASGWRGSGRKAKYVRVSQDER